MLLDEKKGKEEHMKDCYKICNVQFLFFNTIWSKPCFVPSIYSKNCPEIFSNLFLIALFSVLW